MSWKAEVVADNSGRWIGNHMCFATREEAEAYVRDLKSRWKAVRNTRVVESNQRINYRVVNGRARSREHPTLRRGSLALRNFVLV